jgi:hypothetical protein
VGKWRPFFRYGRTLFQRHRDPVLGPFLGLSWPNADAPSWRRKTPYVVQGTRARLRDLALQLSILRRIPSRQAATGAGCCTGREYGRWAPRLG